MAGDLRALRAEATDAITRARDLDAARSPAAAAAQLKVSRIEEAIAELLPGSSPEGASTRRGAAWAAVAAKDFDRARGLVERYAEEVDVDRRPWLVSVLPRMLSESFVDDSLRQVLEESRKQCVAEAPCPALLQVLDSLDALNPQREKEWVVLTEEPDYVPATWSATGDPVILTFDEYAQRLADMADAQDDACEPHCVALPVVRDRLAAWLADLRRDHDLVVITPDR